uniref:Enoyl CoA hydratase domain containing 2 n=1 Tax=Paramormyrops kingsleyae TaxID=1676925 RepID=A0A3B3SBG5_9TELE
MHLILTKVRPSRPLSIFKVVIVHLFSHLCPIFHQSPPSLKTQTHFRDRGGADVPAEGTKLPGQSVCVSGRSPRAVLRGCWGVTHGLRGGDATSPCLQMREVVAHLHGDGAVRVVVFRSLVPGVFCAGADLKERAKMTNSEAEHLVHGLRSLMTEIAVLPMPTVAAVDGFALGGGLELALACDLRTAASTAQMGLIEATRGLLPGAGGSQRLPRLVGFAVAKEMIFTGQRVTGERALQLGLVNRVAEQNEAGDAAYREALQLARQILPQAPIALRMVKEAISRGVEVDIDTGMAIEGMCYAKVRWPNLGCRGPHVSVLF